MTKAEQIRATVLQAINDGASEEEAAAAAGIEEERVQKILDALEWERPEPPPEKQPRKVVLLRSVHRSVKYTDKREPRKRPPPKGTPIGRPPTAALTALHGTISGYNAHHQRKGEPPCDECKEAIRLRSADRRHKALTQFISEEEATLYLSGISKFMEMYRCDECRFWHVAASRTKLTPEQESARRATKQMRRSRKRVATLAQYALHSKNIPSKGERVITTREEIKSVLAAHLWTVDHETEEQLIASWRRRKVALEFDTSERLVKAATEAPKPFNAGVDQTPISTNRKRTVLSFIRGES